MRQAYRNQAWKNSLLEFHSLENKCRQQDTITFNETIDFNVNKGDPAWVTLFDETIPGLIYGDGTPFHLAGGFSDTMVWTDLEFE